MKKNIRNESKYIEEWALSNIIDNYDIKNKVDTDKYWLERVVSDLSATYPLSIFRTLPNYARLLVIQALEWHNIVSMDNIHHVERELRNEEDAYVNYDWFIVDTARKIKRNEGTLNV